MHDTRLHTEIEHGWPELMAKVFAEASRRLKEAGVGLPSIKARPPSERSLDGTREHAYHYDEYGQMSEPSKSIDQ